MFLVGTDRNTGLAAIPLQFHSAAQRGCADRLRSRSSAEVDMAQRDLSRGEAIEKAKASPNDVRGPTHADNSTGWRRHGTTLNWISWCSRQEPQKLCSPEEHT